MPNRARPISDFYKERNQAIYQTYLGCARSHREPTSVDTLIDEVSRSRQPRFWVPSRTVYNIIRRHRKDASLAKQKPLIRDVMTAYNRIRNKRDLRDKSLSFVADFVTAEPTTGFYLSHRRLFDIIRRIRKDNFKARCAMALQGMQSYERHTLLYGLTTK